MKRNYISPFEPTQTMPSLNRLHTIIDIDKGRIPDNPRLQGGRVPEDVYASNPFFFGGANIRRYRNVDGASGRGFWKDFGNSFTATTNTLGTIPLATSIATGNPDAYAAHLASLGTKDINKKSFTGGSIGCSKCKCARMRK